MKGLVLQAVRVLRDTVMSYPEFKLDIETMESWTAEVEGDEAIQIDDSTSPVYLELSAIENLSKILTRTVNASGPMRVWKLKDQALKVLTYIHIYTEKYKLVQGGQVHYDIGRFMERLRWVQYVEGAI